MTPLDAWVRWWWGFAAFCGGVLVVGGLLDLLGLF